MTEKCKLCQANDRTAGSYCDTCRALVAAANELPDTNAWALVNRLRKAQRLVGQLREFGATAPVASALPEPAWAMAATLTGTHTPSAATRVLVVALLAEG